ncbi:putative inactive serine/threonine-protein kinase At5g11400 isoform X2 [Brassica napus]|uniref:putative inactive serine/threonine-protein kinase At5g11400 isoform X2 n=1 Tax=Brassica napus TaxID=3708 RepID=UPI002078D698|nr:putative inactive serine/threonine-protein kinase At5g11400 isoform X2 [Brassica napus]
MGNVLKPLTEDPLSFAYHPLLSPPCSLDKENEDLRVFSVTELKKATKNFKKDSVVQGEDGSVRTFYKGSIDDTTSRTKTRISVSVMECVQDSLEAIEAWKEEVKSLGKHSHPNIVKFLGYCCEDKKSLLVFEYLHKGTLDHHFQGKNEVLSWVKIAIGIAQGVAFLHSIKNSSLYLELRRHNIMLDEEYNAKLFYLETDKKCLEKGLRVVRGIKYMPPERLRTGRFEMDSDVFTFGMILLELFTGLKGALLPPLIALRDGSKKLEDESLDIRTRPFLFNDRIDPRLEGDYPVTAAMQMGTIIQRCTEDRPTRPSMQQVLDVLNHIAEIHSYRYEFSCC